MNHHNNVNSRAVRNPQLENLSDDSLSGDEDEIPQNPVGGFENRNRVYELTSQVNALSIQKEQLIISYENTLNEERRRSYEVSSINEKMTVKNKSLFDENEKLRETLDHIYNENETLSREIEQLKEQLEALMSENRRTAEFHNSADFDHLEIIKELTTKDEQIKRLQEQI